MKIIVTMAGEGVRLQSYGDIPKPMITVGNKTILEHSLDTFKGSTHGVEHIFVIKREHEETYRISSFIHEIALERDFPYKIFLLDKTEGQADSLAQVLDTIPDQPFAVLNADNYIDLNLYEWEKLIGGLNPSILLTTFIDENRSGKWCYVLEREHYLASSLIEKSCPMEKNPTALAGLFYFSNTHDYLESYGEIKKLSQKVNNEYYISTVINHMMSKGTLADLMPIRSMSSLGTEEEIKEFLNA